MSDVQFVANDGGANLLILLDEVDNFSDFKNITQWD
jgi:hypothetical protein